MRAYVTGIAGFIGSHVADRLLADGWDVDGCDDLSTGRASNVPAAARWSVVRVQDVERVDCDVVIHLAAIACARWPRDRDVWLENLGAAAHVLALAGEARVVFASTAAARNPLSSAYAGSKWAAERLVGAYGGTVLRFANVYGPRQRDWGHEPGVLAAWAAADTVRIDGDGSQTRDFIRVDAVARAVAAAASSDAADGAVIDVCTGVQTPIRAMADRLYPDKPRRAGERAAGDPDRVVQDPAPAKRVLGFVA